MCKYFIYIFQILVELTRLYGRSEYDMPKLYRTLRRKTFPPLGQSLELKVKIKGEKEGIKFNWFYQEIGANSINLPENRDRLNGRCSKQEVNQLNWFYRKLEIHSIDLARNRDRFYWGVLPEIFNRSN